MPAPWSEKPVRDLLTAFSLPVPTAGGGSASAVAAVMGAALLLKVARLRWTRRESGAELRRLRTSSAALARAVEHLTHAIDADVCAYDHVVIASRAARASAPDDLGREGTLQEALQEATDTPLKIMRFAADALKLGRIVAFHAPPSAHSDVAVAIHLLRAAGRGACSTVESNLSRLRNRRYLRETRRQLAALKKRTASTLRRLNSHSERDRQADTL
jgi:formiminotetrahydrofolate cyclodeaminase